MSWTEVNDREGLPYGGMPYEESLWRMEETDPDLVRKVRAARPVGNARDAGAIRAPYADGDFDGGPNPGFEDGGGYDDYVRSEIIDWTPNAPYLESDHQRRDPSLSRSQINVRYNGNRGNYDYLPQHAELFYGFTGNDPRGAQNDPLLNEIRGQMTARAENITVRMGNNDTTGEAERPWTNQSISYGMKEVQRRAKRAAKIFSVQREGRPWARNVTADALKYGKDGGTHRAAAMGNGVEGLPSIDARFQRGDEGGEGLMHAPRTSDGGRAANAQAAGPWRHTGGTTDMGKAAVSQQRGSGRGMMGSNVVGGALAKASAMDQKSRESFTSNMTARQTLTARAGIAAKMAMAAMHGNTVNVADQRQSESVTGRSSGMGATYRDIQAAQKYTGLSGPRTESTTGIVMAPGAPTANMSAAQRASLASGSTARQRGEVADGVEVAQGRTVMPSGQTMNASYKSEANASRNAHLINAVNIAAALKAGNASALRKVADHAIFDGTRAVERSDESVGATSMGLRPRNDPGRRNAAVDADAGPGVTSAASRQLGGVSYQSTPLQRQQNVSTGATTLETTEWRKSDETQQGQQKMPEHRGGNDNSTSKRTASDANSNSTFAIDHSVGGRATFVGSMKHRGFHEGDEQLYDGPEDSQLIDSA